PTSRSSSAAPRTNGPFGPRRLRPNPLLDPIRRKLMQTRIMAVIGTNVLGGLLLAASLVAAQRPEGGQGGAPGSPEAADLVARMMAFDKDQDGKLTRSEVTDARLNRLFDRADADHDGIVTRDELTTLAAREAADDRGGPPGGGPPGFPPRRGGP